MIEVLATGDHHYKRGARWAECLRVHAWILEEVRRRRPALFVSTGDVFDSVTTPEERLELAAFVVNVAEICDVLLVRGNHDRPRELELLAGLEARHRIVVEEGAGVHVFPGERMFDSAADEVVEVGGLAVAAFAWPSRSSIAAGLGARSSEEVGQLGREALRRVFRGLGERLRVEAHLRSTLLVGHAMVTGARVTEHGQPLPFGEEVAVGLEDLELAGAEAVLLGHIHLAQQWDRPGGPIAYTGSPFRNTFGEADPKSITSLRFLDEGGVELERIPTPAAPMILVSTPAELARVVALTEDELDRAEVRIRYDVEPDQRVEARAEMTRATARLEGLVRRLVVEERVTPRTTARAPEIAAAAGTAAQLAELWKRQGRELLDYSLTDEGRVARLLGRLAELEEVTP